jgi:hypothetical protein
MSDETTDTQTAESNAPETPERPTGCYQHESGTFIHRSPHTCPSYLHGKLPSRRRMIP